MTLGWFAYSSIAWGTEAMWTIVTNFRRSGDENVIEDFRDLRCIGLSFPIFIHDYITPISKLLVRHKRRNRSPELFVMFFTIFLKVYSHGWFSYLSNIISMPPIFLPVGFTKSLEFVPGHIPGILCLSEFGIHIRYGLFRYDFLLHWGMRINNISN